MKTDVLLIDNREDSQTKALALAEAVAVFYALPKKDALHLRLLTEETMGLIRELTGEITSRFWIETENDAFYLHLAVRTQMDADKRSELLAVSTSGKNAAAKGLKGKLRDIMERAIDSIYAPDSDIATDYALLDEMGTTGRVTYGRNAAVANWSLQLYREAARKMAEDRAEGGQAAWDELERSIVGRLADEISIGIRGSDVEMIITMKKSA